MYIFCGWLLWSLYHVYVYVKIKWKLSNTWECQKGHNISLWNSTLKHNNVFQMIPVFI